ncbi:MAG: EthD family reductase [Candidatus Tectomicrobia bacterium]|uniref:EthD family reductase n=1 Tax=Tectimicrobiota bacterium TaxID=2528274 RepID=A0A933GMJ4_UNCTE|nr:EthD family reductase [Candidatus Tectomicrobia bacterium]
MIKRIFLFSYREELGAEGGENWYLDQHTQLAKKMPGIIKYVTYKAISNTGKVYTPPPSFYRWTEIWWGDLSSVEKAMSSEEGKAAWRDNKWPGGGNKYGAFKSVTVANPLDLLNPSRKIDTEQWLNEMSGRPAVKYVLTFNYPADMTFEEGEKWYLHGLVPLGRKMPGIIRYVTWRAIQLAGEKPPEFTRLTEVWFQDIEAWQKAMDSEESKASAKFNRHPDGSWFLNTHGSLLERPAVVGYEIRIA